MQPNPKKTVKSVSVYLIAGVTTAALGCSGDDIVDTFVNAAIDLAGVDAADIINDDVTVLLSDGRTVTLQFPSGNDINVIINNTDGTVQTSSGFVDIEVSDGAETIEVDVTFDEGDLAGQTAEFDLMSDDDFETGTVTGNINGEAFSGTFDI